MSTETDTERVDLREQVRRLVEQAAGDAYEVGHAHGGNVDRRKRGLPAERTDEGWQDPSDRAVDAIMAVLAAAAPQAPFPVDLDEVRQRGRAVGRILSMVVWPGGMPAEFGLHLSGDVGAMLQEIDHLRGVLGARNDGYEGDALDLSLRGGGVVSMRRRASAIRLAAFGPPGGEQDVASMDPEESDRVAVALAAAAASARRERRSA